MTARKYFVGDVFETNSGSKAVITSLDTNRKQYVIIKWLDEFGYEMEVNTSNLSQGRVLNPYEKTVLR